MNDKQNEEKDVMSLMNKNELGIYVHIPFCKSKCSYCDFISYPDKLDKASTYFKVLNEELDCYDLNKYNVTTIYIGGGTPSYVDSKYICDILDRIKNKLYSGANSKKDDNEEDKKEINKKTGNQIDYKDIEITIEVNPGTITEEKLLMYKKAGINRISIGLQSTDNLLLKQIGRIHTFQDFISTYELAKKVGFNNINVDLMIGLPNQTIEDLKKSLEEIKKLDSNHVSVYSLIVEEGTKLEKQIRSGELVLPDEELERQMYWYVKNTLELIGYNHYEISNFSKRGYESKHNLNCWEQKEYIGLGVAAHSYLNGIRYSNTSNFEEYINAEFKDGIMILRQIKNYNKENEPNKFEEEKRRDVVKIIEEIQTIKDKRNEYMLLGFRKIDGIDISKFKEKFVDNPIFLYKDKLSKLVEERLIEIDLNNIKLTSKGIDLANLVFEEFI